MSARRFLPTTREQAMAVFCPACGSPAGDPCRLARPRRNGQTDRASCHIERHRNTQEPTFVIEDTHDWSRLRREAERALAESAAQIERTVRGTPSGRSHSRNTSAL
jgi:hypothetical protein